MYSTEYFVKVDLMGLPSRLYERKALCAPNGLAIEPDCDYQTPIILMPLDAACVGATPGLRLLTNQLLVIKSARLGTRQMCGTNKYGFPIRYRSNTQTHEGFQTGDIVKAAVPSGKKIGVHVGRVLCRAQGTFDISTKHGQLTGISYKFCTHIHQKDGYSYGF